MTGGQAILGVSWASISLGTVVVSLRLYSRVSQKTMSADDYTIGAALVVCIFGSIANTFQVVNGAGQHVAHVHPAQLSNWSKWTWIVIFQTTVATTLVRISIFLFILRILGPTHKCLRRVVVLMLSCLVAISSAFLVLLLFRCRPLKAVWDLELKGKCYSKQLLLSGGYAFGAYNVLMDLLCAGLPAFIIRELQMSIRSKYALSILMGLGVFTAVCLVVRLATDSALVHEDAIYDATTTSVFQIMEQNLGLTLASIPSLAKMFQRVVNKILNCSNSLGQLFRVEPTDAEVFGDNDLQAKNPVRSTRDYYELQETIPGR